MINTSVTSRPPPGDVVTAFERGALMTWTASKSSALRIAEKYLESPYEEHVKYTERILGCASQLSFRLRYVHREKITYDPDAEDVNDTVEYHSGYFVEGNLENAWLCRCRNCAVCIKARVRKHRARLFQAFELMEKAYPDHKWIFLTLTTKQPALTDVRSHLEAMNKAWDRLQRCKEFPGVGFVKSFEFTGPKQEGGGNWESGPMHVHPHFHCLVMVPPSYFGGKSYISQERWRQLWQRSLKVDYLPVVNVKKVTANPKKGVTTVKAAVLETVKYSVKPTTLAEAPPIWLAEITQQLHKTRSLTVGGLVREFVSQAELDRIDTEVTGDNEVKQEGEFVTFSWDGEAYRSKQVVNFGSVKMDCCDFDW